MFLNRLDHAEKEAFLSLAVTAAKANGKYTDEEYQMIEEYCREMGITFFDSQNVKSIDEIISIYSGAEEQHKKIAILEIIGFMYAEGNYDDEERAFVKNFSDGIGVTQDTVSKFEENLVSYMDMTRKLSKCVE